ncbi:type I HSP40 co-chaperone YDJ1 [Sugiyamaella lignohabitans]|uniref:Type I HSP40 co-chaperone YDJ1 n=1 Tax=Sugiyamaella lignohabitans TaxID=796027 RepID=A0A167F7K5_9ASCO|nr:type I HSP40 co-chaperone YDJ1 [Sugiyamaella lignohabitans]ANB14914.1 type I HSP40 co-chaperone YDJ1 [Sugiyamaella lignohabitans]
MTSETLDPSITAQTDLYGLLEIDVSSQESDIRRAYRRVALKYHPDKNPSEEAKVKFHSLNLALETLVSENLRRAYDQLRKAWIEKEARRKELDANRRKLQQDLEQSEKVAVESAKAASDAKRKLELLKMEGLKKRRLHEEKMEKRKAQVQVANDKNNDKKSDSATKSAARSRDMSSSPDLGETDATEEERTVKLRFRYTPTQEWTEQQISDLFSRFGAVDHVVIMPVAPGKKFFTVVIVFQGLDGAQLCVSKDFTTLGPDFKAVKSASLLHQQLSTADQPTPSPPPSAYPANSSRPIDRNSSDYAQATLRRLQMLSKAHESH